MENKQKKSFDASILDKMDAQNFSRWSVWQKKQKESQVDIPVDLYDSPTEFVVVMPLWWVDKQSVSLTLSETTLTIKATRTPPKLKDALAPKQQKCFWGSFVKHVTLPANSYFNNIHSTLTPENILIVTVPKVFIPEELTVDIQ